MSRITTQEQMGRFTFRLFPPLSPYLTHILTIISSSLPLSSRNLSEIFPLSSYLPVIFLFIYTSSFRYLLAFFPLIFPLTLSRLHVIFPLYLPAIFSLLFSSFHLPVHRTFPVISPPTFRLSSH